MCIKEWDQTGDTDQTGADRGHTLLRIEIIKGAITQQAREIAGNKKAGCITANRLFGVWLPGPGSNQGPID